MDRDKARLVAHGASARPRPPESRPGERPHPWPPSPPRASSQPGEAEGENPRKSAAPAHSSTPAPPLELPLVLDLAWG
jgi:hypothetical protein